MPLMSIWSFFFARFLADLLVMWYARFASVSSKSKSFFLIFTLLSLELLAGDPCLEDPSLHDGGTKKIFN
jgi:hypothetical protein